jgi:C1A family cysteine protease
MFRSLLFASAIAAIGASNIDFVANREHYEKEFFDWMEKFQVKFKNGAEFIQRLKVFADNYDMIRKHNSEKHSYTMGLNQFAHLTHSEFLDHVRIGGTHIPAQNLRRGAPGAPLHTKTGENPESVDWTAKGAVTPVKNQGQCGSCWSFSTTGSIEGAYFLKYGTLESFSEQNLVSCDTTDQGCNGGWMDDAFTWMKGNGGICTEADYPYTSGTTGQSGSCNQSSCTKNANSAPVSYTDVTPNSVEAMESAVAQQPVSIAIQANQPAFQFYSGGVLTGTCGQRLDHGVLNTGYGTSEDGINYWQVKNSWGESWGMDGYILIEKSDANKCGVLSAASYPNM